MKTAKLSTRYRSLISFIYLLVFVFVAYYVFVANDESQPLIEIFQLNYLLPVLIYASGVTGLSFILFLGFRRLVPTIISILLSIILGLPLGVITMMGFFYLISSF